MIGVGFPSPAVWPFYKHRLGGPPPPPAIVRSWKANATGTTNLVTILNVISALNELLVVSMCYDNADIRAAQFVHWGATHLNQEGAGFFGLLGDRVLEIWTVRAPVAATRTMTIQWTGVVRSTIIIEGYTNITSALGDQSSLDTAPPNAPGSIPDSLPTLPTSQPHELIFGAMAAQPSNPFGAWILPLVVGTDHINVPAGQYLKTGWCEVNAIGAYRALLDTGPIGGYWCCYVDTFLGA